MWTLKSVSKGWTSSLGMFLRYMDNSPVAEASSELVFDLIAKDTTTRRHSSIS